MKKKNGFTLVELLAVIVILGVVGAILVYNVVNISRKTSDSDYERFINQVESSASTYVNLNPDVVSELYETREYVYLTIGELEESGLIDEGLKNPYTKEVIGKDELVKVNLDSETGNISVTYPIEDENANITLKAITYTMTTGSDKFTCLTGEGTYNLTFVDKDGKYIEVNEETVDKYKLTCTYDSNSNLLKKQ